MNSNKVLAIAIALFANFVSGQSNEEFAAIEIEVKSVESVIRGTLLTPDSTARLPLVIVVPGSGSVERAQNMGIAKALFQGIPTNVFVYDKRGVGESTGEYLSMNTETSTDRIPLRTEVVLDIVNHLYNTPYVDREKIGLIGSSQGGWVSPLAASKSTKISFVICLSGVACTVGASDYYSDIVKDLSIEEATSKLEAYSGPQGYDPEKALKKIAVPVLWVYGGKDRSNPSLYDLKILRRLQDEYNKDFTIHFYENYNHEMIDESTGAFGVEVIPDLRKWYLEQISSGS